MSMRAMGIRRYGGVDEIVPLAPPIPEPGPQDLVVRVITTSVNPADLRARAPSAVKTIEREFPVVLGYDVCGVGSRKGLCRSWL